MLTSAKSAPGALSAGALGVALLLTLAPAARAESHPLRVDYRAPSSCPDEAAFVARVRARVEVREALPGETVPTFGVTLLVDGERVIARIASVSERSEPTSRVVSGTNCSDVADAVALIVAMALSPSAAAAANAGTGSAQTRAKVDPSADGSPPPESHAPERDAPAVEKSTPSSAPEPRFRLLGSAMAETGIGYIREVSLFAPGARLQLFRTRGYVGGPSVALGFAAMLPTERQMPEGRATVSFNIGELFACPLSFALSQAVTVLPCARVDVGQVKAVGNDIPGAHTETRTWATAGVLGQIALVPVKPLVIDAQASLLLPLTPYEFIFRERSVIYSAPGVAFSASLAIGVMFL